MLENTSRSIDRKVLRNIVFRSTTGLGNTPFRLVLSAGSPTGSTNKYVYDASIYTNYKRLLAQGNNYNDTSSGGANNGAQVALARVRH